MATRLPPAEKFPLALRKDIRDGWENKRLNLEKQLSDVLGVSWTVDIDPKSIYPYAEEGGYAKASLGSCLAQYVEGAIFQLKHFASSQGTEGVQGLNTLCKDHVLTMDLDEKKQFPYCGADIHDGKLRILFALEGLGVNIDYALELSTLKKAVVDASDAGGVIEGGMSYAARSGISKDYEKKIEEVRQKVASILENPDIKFTPSFESTYETLTAESRKSGTQLGSDWQAQLGSYTFLYFEGLATQLAWQKFGEDELLREGFNEGVGKSEVAFRIVDKLQHENYCECVFEDGVLYLQCEPETWGVNITDCAQNMVDRL